MSFIKKIFKSGENKSFVSGLEKIIGFRPKKLNYYQRALTHPSKNLRDENGNAFSYERLEYLGDAVLSTIIAQHLYITVPNADEGYLTKMRSKIVSRDHLNKIGKGLKLLALMRSNIKHSKLSENTHGNLLESLIGAVFLDKGFKGCNEFVYNKIINPHVNISLLEGKIISYKSLIIEWCQKEKKEFFFSCNEDEGAEELKHFSASLKIDGVEIAKARATSRKKAEEKASQRSYFALQDKVQF